MIDKNRSADPQEVRDEQALTYVRAGITSALFRENLIIQDKPLVNVEKTAARAVFCFQDSGLDLSTHARAYGRLLNNAGRAAYAERQYRGAELAWSEAMQARNTDIDSRFRLGIVRLCTGDSKGAEHALYGASIAAIGQLDSIRETQREFAAIGRSTSGLELAAQVFVGKCADLFGALGESRLAHGKYGPAARAFERCLQLDPNHAGIDERLRIAYASLAQSRFTN